MKTKRIFFIAFSLAILIGIAGCAPNDTGLNTNTDRLSTQTRVNRNRNWNMNNDNDFGDLDNFDLNGRDNTNLNNGMVRRNGTNNQTSQNDMNNRNTTANELARKIAALPEVENASVVLTDDTCLVGLDLDNNNNNNSASRISTTVKEKIEDMVEDSTNIDNENISITADPNLLTRIQSLSQRMTTNVGNDVKDFTNDIEDIIRAIVPGNGNGNSNTINNR